MWKHKSYLVTLELTLSIKKKMLPNLVFLPWEMIVGDAIGILADAYNLWEFKVKL